MEKYEEKLFKQRLNCVVACYGYLDLFPAHLALVSSVIKHFNHRCCVRPSHFT